jgi:hypothetical protein
MLDGFLVVTVLPGTEVQPGEQFTVLTAADVQGSFAQVVSTQSRQVTYTPTEVILTAQDGTTCTPTSAADLDNDCDVDVGDLELLAACLLGEGVAATGSCLLADLDPSGDVELADAALMQQYAAGVVSRGRRPRRGSSSGG